MGGGSGRMIICLEFANLLNRILFFGGKFVAFGCLVGLGEVFVVVVVGFL
jgi:hypothetical protein